MMRDTILTFNHERFGTVRTVRLRTDCYIVAEDLCRMLEVEPDTAKRRLREDSVQSREETLPWVMGQALEPRRKVALLDKEAVYSLAWISPLPNARRISTWIREVVLPMTEFLSREELRFGAGHPIPSRRCVEVSRAGPLGGAFRPAGIALSMGVALKH